MRKDNVNIQRIIKELKKLLSTGTEMNCIKNLNINEDYKQKEIDKVIKQIKRRKIKNFIKNFFIG